MIMTEDQKRRTIIATARKEFITTGITNNISGAVRLYFEAHPDICKDVKMTISTREEDRPKTILDEYERPKCRKCGSPLFWKGACTACKGKKNQWVCKKCGFKHITKDTLEQAIGKLDRRK